METLLHHSISEIDQQQWKKLEPENFPFASYEFISKLESSQSVGKRTGWFPLIFTVLKGKELTGAASLYLKTNSYGEYIFDWAWADAWQKSGLQYYPKLVAAAPFTPATGPKILVKKGQDKNEIAKALFTQIKDFIPAHNISTVHFLFIPEHELKFFKENGYTIRKTFQFHWHNNGYKCFDDFLMAMKQKKRKEIRRERKLLTAENLEVREITGKEVIPYADLMYDFYLSTIDKKWSSDYLTKQFFMDVFSTMNEQIVLFIAFKKDIPIAGTLNFHKGNSLFGRYWGCSEEIQNLHFELCYYRPIEYAIRENILLFEAGAQGEHKIQRGFIPSYTYSAHLLPEHGLGGAVKDYIKNEAARVDLLIKEGPGMVYK